MINLLNNKPVIGFVAGASSGVLYALKSLLTNDDLLKSIAGLGIWMGFVIAILTVYLRIIEIIKAHKNQKE